MVKELIEGVSWAAQGFMEQLNWREDFHNCYRESVRNYPVKEVEKFLSSKKIYSPEYQTKVKSNFDINEGIKYKVLSLSDLKNYECPVYTWRIDSILQDKKIIIFAGSSAVFKSWLNLYLGLCVAKGVPFLDNFSTEQGGVLFIDRENSIPELQNRVEMISKGMGLSETEDLPMFFLSEQDMRLDNENSRKFLEDYIIKNNIKIVIVDTYRRVIGFEENNANDVSLFFTQGLKPLCERSGASFVFIHHHKKGQKDKNDPKELLRGSSDLVNFVDGVIQVERKGAKLRFIQTKNRSGKEIEPFDISVETDEEDYFRFRYLGSSRDLSVSAKATEHLILWISKEKIEEFETKEAREECSKNNIKKMACFEGLRELEKRGIIIKIGKGKYKIDHLNDSPLSTPKGVGQLDNQNPLKCNNPNIPNGQIGQLDNQNQSKFDSSESSIEQVEQDQDFNIKNIKVTKMNRYKEVIKEE